MSFKDAPIHYTITNVNIAKHLFSIQLHIKPASPRGHILSLPAWIPGSYMIRDFAKNITQINAHTSTGEPITVTAIDKQQWQVAAHEGNATISYDVYALDLSVRSAYLDSEFGFANGTSLFLQVDAESGAQQDGIAVTMALPDNKPNWQLATAMTPASVASKANTQSYQFYCENYADLIEHPLLMGDLLTTEFTVNGVEFELIFVGQHDIASCQLDLNRMANDLAKIAEHHLALFDSPSPVQRYLFLTMLTESDFGGLEHSASTALVYSRDELPTIHDQKVMSKGYRTFLSLCSHELLHTWHVKRTKPALFTTPDLSQEAYTEQLWIYEGFTSYYDDFSLHRAGLISAQSYLELVGQNLTKLHRCQGRFKQTITESSWFAWTKFYKQDENALNAIVSYYTKGAVIALCLDLKLRSDSQNSQSLDTIMRTLWKQHGQTNQGTPDNIIHQILQKLGYDYDRFLQDALYTTQELPVAELLQNYGIELRYRPRLNAKDTGGTAINAKFPLPINEFGAQYKTAELGVIITQVMNDSPAEQALLTKGDHLVAVNAQQITANNLSKVIDKQSQGESVELHYFRRGKLHTAVMPIEPVKKDTVYLEVVDQAACNKWLTVI